LTTRIIGASIVGLLFCLAAAAQQPDYFPLQVGNQWIYGVGGTRAASALVVEITQSQVFHGQTYYQLTGSFQQAYWLREDMDGKVYAYDPLKDQEQLWYAFQTPEGQQYDESIPACCGKAVIRSRSAVYSGPIGQFSYALEQDYPGVFQVGIDKEVFLPYIGMIYRLQNTGGPSIATFDLIYARVRGVTVVSGQEVTFSLTLDRAVYVPGPQTLPRPVPTMTARMTLRVVQEQPLALTFNTGQFYELVIRSANGDTVYRWSNGRAFPQLVQTIPFGPGEKNFVVVASLGTDASTPFPPGKYSAEGYLNTAGAKSYSATVAFEVK
jgi:hypothetical protein